MSSSPCTSSDPYQASTNDQYLNKIIAVFAFIAAVSVMAVVLVTYVATKRFTKKKLLKRSNLPSDGSPDPCEVNRPNSPRLPVLIKTA